MTQSEIIEQKNALYSEKKTLQSQLNSGDYKVIKCAEAQAAKLPLPYNINALHAERQTVRDRINAIELEIAKLDGIKPDDEGPITE